MNILILGGSGFVGGHLVDLLLENENKLVIFDLKNTNKKVSFKKVNILNTNLTEEISRENPDWIINLVAVRASSGNYQEEFRINSIGCSRVFEAAKNLKIPLLHFSSTAVYGEFTKTISDENHPFNPIDSYGLSKLIGEQIGAKIIADANTPCVIFRPTIIYGPNGTDVVTLFVRKAIRGKPLTVFDNGKYKRDFLYVKDLVNAVNLVLNAKKSGIFNIGTGKETTILEVANTVKAFIPDTKILNVESAKKEVDQGAVDITKAKKELKFEPEFTLERGVKETIDFYSNNI